MHVAGHGRDLASLGLRLAAQAGHRSACWPGPSGGGPVRCGCGRCGHRGNASWPRPWPSSAGPPRTPSRPAWPASRRGTRTRWSTTSRRRSARMPAGPAVGPGPGPGCRRPLSRRSGPHSAAPSWSSWCGSTTGCMAVTVNRPTQPPGRPGRRDPGGRCRRGVGVRGPAARRRRLTGGARPRRGDVAQRGRRSWTRSCSGRCGPSVGDRPVVLVPTAALQSVPWSLLPSLTGRAVNVAPSAAIWLSSTTAGRRDGTDVVALAGPGLAPPIARSVRSRGPAAPAP